MYPIGEDTIEEFSSRHPDLSEGGLKTIRKIVEMVNEAYYDGFFKGFNAAKESEV